VAAAVAAVAEAVPVARRPEEEERAAAYIPPEPDG